MPKRDDTQRTAGDEGGFIGEPPPGLQPEPTPVERETVDREIAEGKWSESRQRADFTGANKSGADRDDERAGE